jgi:hypothetical protein
MADNEKLPAIAAVSIEAVYVKSPSPVYGTGQSSLAKQPSQQQVRTSVTS